MTSFTIVAVLSLSCRCLVAVLVFRCVAFSKDRWAVMIASLCDILYPFVDRRVQALLKRVRFPSGDADTFFGSIFGSNTKEKPSGPSVPSAPSASSSSGILGGIFSASAVTAASTSGAVI